MLCTSPIKFHNYKDRTVHLYTVEPLMLVCFIYMMTVWWWGTQQRTVKQHVYVI